MCLNQSRLIDPDCVCFRLFVCLNQLFSNHCSLSDHCSLSKLLWLNLHRTLFSDTPCNHLQPWKLDQLIGSIIRNRFPRQSLHAGVQYSTGHSAYSAGATILRSSMRYYPACEVVSLVNVAQTVFLDVQRDLHNVRGHSMAHQAIPLTPILTRVVREGQKVVQFEQSPVHQTSLGPIRPTSLVVYCIAPYYLQYHCTAWAGPSKRFMQDCTLGGLFWNEYPSQGFWKRHYGLHTVRFTSLRLYTSTPTHLRSIDSVDQSILIDPWICTRPKPDLGQT